mmetsp:Transcript_27904/g.42781  ORF Transcript_27904/g.42781 Transcript_27904/m.42781 type:complete len:86 (+) Transcript_27904:155-412(+)
MDGDAIKGENSAFPIPGENDGKGEAKEDSLAAFVLILDVGMGEDRKDSLKHGECKGAAIRSCGLPIGLGHGNPSKLFFMHGDCGA